jgi:hypothetical protein
VARGTLSCSPQMIRRSNRSDESRYSDAPTVQADPGSTAAARRAPLFQLARKPHPCLRNRKYRLTSGFRTRSAGNQIAAVTFPWGLWSQPGSTVPHRPDVRLNSNTR